MKTLFLACLILGAVVIIGILFVVCLVAAYMPPIDHDDSDSYPFHPKAREKL